MRGLGRAVAVVGLCLAGTGAMAGTEIKITHAWIDVANESVELRGVNFTALGPLLVSMGSFVLEDCTVTDTEVSCPLNDSAEPGQSWTVTVSSGNAPGKNEEIDVAIPPEVAPPRCTPGDMVQCYSSDPSIVGTGQCRSGYRTCQAGGTWNDACVGEVLPIEEVCGDNLDNDCDGETDDEDACSTCACEYSGACYVTGAAHPVQGCLQCGPNGWANAPEGNTCLVDGAEGSCSQGTCITP